MAGSEGSKYYDVFLDYKIWLFKNHENIIEHRLFNLLDKIQSEGSLSKAARVIGISYRKAWGDLKKAEETLGFQLVDKQRGGEKGGKSVLTEDGQNIINAYNELILEFDKSIYNVTKKFFRTINA